MLGHKVGDPARGANIRIGVIDAGFTPDRSLAHIQMIETAGDIVDDVGDYWIHGEVISRIISDRDAPACCAPIAPGAELFFASATYNGSMAGSPAFRFPISGSPGSSHLDPTLIADAIFEMALNHDVDLINISAGASALPAEVERGVAEAIETAAEMGTVVVCAAGNEYATPADFPARHPATIGVGAFGQTGWGPPGSAVRDFVTGTVGGDGRWLGRNVFHWSDSAYGEGVDTVGPGIGILVARDGKPAFDLSGTSFSAPIVLGTLAVELSQDETYLSLPRDQARLEYVKGVLELYCRSAQMPAQLEGAGILELG
jgi:subtilisin family serine protease